MLLTITTTHQPTEKAEEGLEKPISLNEQRLGAVVASLRAERSGFSTWAAEKAS